jgi:YgiT-type zinc finger domain-containing protein
LSFSTMYVRILRQIQTLARQGDYVLSLHVENELENDDFTDRDLEAALLNGKIVRREKDTLGRPKYVIAGTTLDGRGLTVHMMGEVCVRCCEGDLKATRGREYFRYRQSLVIIEDVPAWVCNKCGERYHQARVYKKMRQIAAHREQITEHVSIPVAHYQEDVATSVTLHE